MSDQVKTEQPDEAHISPSALNDGLGWRCADCCGTGFHYFSPSEQEECKSCNGTGKAGLTPNVKLRGCPIEKG